MRPSPEGSPVHIEQITADRKTYWQNLYGDASYSQPKLPPLVRDLTIDYTALSLVVPEKVHFRYKLEGWDRDWQDAGTRRQAFYTNLSPRKYRFRVVACNNSGVWNEEGAALDFVIPPAWYQTNWFRVLCVAVFLALLWALHQLRLRQMARQFNMRLEERVGERTRIARDLHDTLLQSFHGVLLHLQTVSNELATGNTKEKIDGVIDQAEQSIVEGRGAVQGLRASTIERNDLALAIRTLGEELAAADTRSWRPEVTVQVEGAARNLNPIVRDEAYRITGEAMRNAFCHADAKQIEVEIHYDDRQFRARVRDNGKGIDPQIISDNGREGHFGLRGMRERAKLIGGKLTVWSELDSGTEVELSIPAGRAYLVPPRRRRSWFVEKFTRRSSDKDAELKS
jgi:signal transduction histidine kinase